MPSQGSRQATQIAAPVAAAGSSRREHLIETALALFNAHGYRATGIDRILAESGVAKMTLYKHFKSKDELILAAIRRRDERWLAWFRDRVERRAKRRGDTPGARLLAVFEVLDDWFARSDFNGCMFIKAAAEYPDLDHPIHAAAAAHHRNVMAYLKDLAAAAGAKRPARLARDILLLMQGAIAVTQVNGPLGAAREAARVAEILIADACGADA